jgi:hypothetical protein
MGHRNQSISGFAILFPFLFRRLQAEKRISEA